MVTDTAEAMRSSGVTMAAMKPMRSPTDKIEYVRLIREIAARAY